MTSGTRPTSALLLGPEEDARERIRRRVRRVGRAFHAGRAALCLSRIGSGDLKLPRVPDDHSGAEKNMAKCTYCDAETQLFIIWTPVCEKCLEARNAAFQKPYGRESTNMNDRPRDATAGINPTTPD